MELVGAKVRHKTLGLGTITFAEDDYITVEFVSRSMRLQFPFAFDQYLTAEDATIQEEITALINAQKAEQERRRREEAARREEETLLREAHTTTKRKKTLDEMFEADYHVEKLARSPILTYEQVEEQFGIRITGFGRGINPTENSIVLISSIDKARGKFVYHDSWTTDSDYIYSGEGKTGDQTMTNGNLAIKEASAKGKKIHLFVKFSPQEYYYQGVFELVNYTYVDEKDEDGNIRKEYKFRLKKMHA